MVISENIRTSKDTEKDLTSLIDGLTYQIGRLPTEEEVRLFIFGNDNERNYIWSRQTDKKDGV